MKGIQKVVQKLSRELRSVAGARTGTKTESSPVYQGTDLWTNLKPCILRRSVSYLPFCFHQRSKLQFLTSRFHEKVPPTNEVQVKILWKILLSWVPCLQNLWNGWRKKWGPTCNCAISNSAPYVTAMYWEYTIVRQCCQLPKISSQEK